MAAATPAIGLAHPTVVPANAVPPAGDGAETDPVDQSTPERPADGPS